MDPLDRWEYQLVPVDTGGDTLLGAATLETLGASGWELAAALPIARHYRHPAARGMLYFKRPIGPPLPSPPAPEAPDNTP